jgi:SpoVK/Ycf46/Vps4 family AAA+-type ATPase
MLFLTTNRREDFDEAFFNRIHVTIEYGDLDAQSRTNIWRHHLQRAIKDNKKPSTWTEEMFSELGAIPLNGRDIKNYVRTAYAFTHAVEGEDLVLDHVLIVLRNSLPGMVGGSAVGAESADYEKMLQRLEALCPNSPEEESETVAGER